MFLSDHVKEALLLPLHEQEGLYHKHQPDKERLQEAQQELAALAEKAVYLANYYKARLNGLYPVDAEKEARLALEYYQEG